ncbi:cytochrome c biogenesis protein CcdC [Paenibacillus cremeus]|uniref:Cytochrome c biogenesis protein CcdC n=1 Tax=Paenibacillus cremeus TaxID=2163881 RepID=A0A559KDQ2_9BACL|nr:cytochrome c biogenesis protein CcdC [Paenibacillus cremeus]TVY10250.1 cytochrome c biogenesis protein CcdC [Paenibacillus cremeus]
MNTSNLAALIPVVIMVSLVLWRRLRATNKPVKGNGYRMLLPLVFMWFGMVGLLNPQLHLTVKEVVLSFLCGLVLSIPMILTTNYEVRDDGHIYPKKSIAFVIALVGLLILRLALREYLQGLDPAELGMLFYFIAIGYVMPWRLVSYLKFRKLLPHRRAE